MFFPHNPGVDEPRSDDRDDHGAATTGRGMSMVSYSVSGGVVRMKAAFLEDADTPAFVETSISAAPALGVQVARIGDVAFGFTGNAGYAGAAHKAFTLPQPVFDPVFGKATTVGPVAKTATQQASAAAPKFAAPGLTDPEAALQWHLAKIGDIATVWKDYTGKGVTVGVFDSGVQYDHWDLAPNYDATKHLTIAGKTYDGDATPVSGGHGTAVAGLIAAARNGVGTVGVAYDATLTGVNIFDPYSGGKLEEGIFINAFDPTPFFEAIRQTANFDVANHSWGSGPYYGTGGDRANARNFEGALTSALVHAAETGRDGLGTINVTAAGNDRLDGIGQGSKSDRHWIAVAAHREADNSASYYSSRGAHLLVSAPSSDFAELGGSGVVATDLLGRYGYNLVNDPGGKLDYTDDFGGTSAASPIVAGVTTLMLDANENLGWRDVREILAASAKLPVAFDTQRTTVTFDERSFILNNATFELAGKDAGWNGGAYHYSTDYGFGAVDALAAVRMAEVWSLFGPAKTSANEVRVESQVFTPNLVATQGTDFVLEKEHNDFTVTPASFSFEITESIDLEHVDMQIGFTSLYDFTGRGKTFATLGTLKLKLIAPDGTAAFVDTLGAGASMAAGAQTFTFGFANFRGAESKGTWTLQVQEHYVDTDTTISTVKLDLYGAESSTGDVFTYTNEFATMAAIAGESGRRTLADTDGGVDWINAAAVSGDVAMSLAEGGITTFGGTRAFKIAAGTKIENAVSGDGNDTLIGNALDNELRGMRGNDTLSGGLGRDRLFGGAGDDTLNGGAGIDLMDGGAGNDLYVVDTDGDLVIEGANGGTDTVNASVAYTLTDNVENLYLGGTARAGTGNALDNGLFGSAGNDALHGQDGNDLLKGWAGDDRLFGDGGRDTLYGAEGNDWLDGGAGADTLQGDGGNDTYIVDDARDVVTEYFMSGQGGVDTIYASVDWTLSLNVENLFLTGNAVNGTGNALDNVLRGTAGANTLRGGAGADTLIGGAGNDTLFGGSGADRFVLADGFGKDIIRDFGAGDMIDLAGYTLNGTPLVTDLGADTLIDLGEGNTILLTGIDPAQISFTGSAFGYIG